MDKLELKVQLGLIDKILKPLKSITSGSSETAKALKAAKDQLKSLNDEQKRVDGFRATSRSIAIQRQELTKAEERIRAVSTAMKAAEYPTKDMQKAFKEATDEAKRLKGNITQLTDKQERLRRELSASGADTHKLASYQRDLKTQMASATTAVEKQSAALDTLNRRQNSLRNARYAYDKTINQRNKIAMAGATTTAAGVAMGVPILKTIKDYASFEDAMLGVARQVDGAKDANGRYTKSYYEMGDSIKALSERLPLTSVEFANIVEAAARMGIQGKENLLAFAETAAKSAIAFDMPVAELSDQMAKLSGLYKIPIKDIAELGDAINYLDDNALAKGGDIINVMQRIAGVTESVGMSYKQSAALASTFLSMGDTAETAATASSAMIMRLSNAPILATAKRYKAGLDMLGLDAHKLQNAMTKDAVGTLKSVMDAINALPENKQLEASTRIFGVEYGHEGTKLAQNVKLFREQLEMVNAEKAKGSMDREALSRAQALSAQYEMTKSAVFNLSSELGQSLKPTLVDILTSIKDVLIQVRAWTQEHPALTAGLIKGTAIIATIVTVIGALIVAVAAVLGPLALLRLAMVMIPGAGALLGWLSPIGKVIAAFTAGYAIGTLLAAGLDTLLSKILGYQTSLGGAIYDLVQWIKAKFNEFVDWITGLPARFIEAGKNMMISLGDGIMNGLSYVKDKLSFLKPLLKFIPGPIGLVMSAVAAASPTTSSSPIKIDSRPPVMSAAAAGAQHTSTGQIVQHIYPSAGMDEQKLAHYVGREFERIDRSKAAKARSQLSDKE